MFYSALVGRHTTSVNIKALNGVRDRSQLFRPTLSIVSAFVLTCSSTQNVQFWKQSVY